MSGSPRGRHQIVAACIATSAFHPDGALARRRQHLLGLQHGRDALGEPEAVEARQRQQGRVPRRPRSTFARRVSTLPRNMTISRSLRACLSWARRRWEAVPTTAPSGSAAMLSAIALMNTSAGIFPRQHARNRDTVGKHGFEVLHGVHGDVDVARQQRLLHLLGEQTLAADLGERPVGHAVAGGADDDELDVVGRQIVVRGHQSGPNLLSLGERQPACRGCRYATAARAPVRCAAMTRVLVRGAGKAQAESGRGRSLPRGGTR